MTLNQLVRKRLKDNKKLTGFLAVYGDKAEPAIFENEAPADQDDGWNGKAQYPRCDFVVDMQANTERESAGTLSVTVYDARNTLTLMAVTAAVKDSFRDILLNPDGPDGPFCLAWARTDGFTLPGTNILGQMTQFDIVEYPDQETTDPDPQAALSGYIKALYPDMIVLGIDDIGQVTDAADKTICYAEIERLAETRGRNMNLVAWLDCFMAVHLLCPDKGTRLKLMASLAQHMQKDDYTLMLDGSMMYLADVQIDTTRDYLRSGQLTLRGHYGVLRRDEKTGDLKGIHIGF